MQYKVFIFVVQVFELNFIDVKEDGLEIGVVVKLFEFLCVLRRVIVERVIYEILFCNFFIE